MQISKPIHSKSDAFWQGMRHCAGVPAIGLGSSMLGYGAYAQYLDMPGWMAWLGVAFIWGLPGQIAMLEMTMVKANLILTFLAVSFANSRLLPVSIAGITLIQGDRKLNIVKRFLLSHFLAVTGWTAIMAIKDQFARSLRLYYYFGFSGTLFISGILCGLFGYYGGASLGHEVLSIFVFMTPLYLLLLVMSARHKYHTIAVFWAMPLGVGLYPFLSDWTVFVVGLFVGSLVWWWQDKRGA